MSRFVSQGSTEDYKAESNDAWTRAKQEVDALKKKTATPQGVQEGGKSLYEHLQANKEKKQAEFEEAQRIKNQFQALSEDDVDFLDSVLASTRAKEAAVKQDTAEQLAAFRKQQGKPLALGIEQEALATAETTWSKKRRRTKDVDGAAAPKLIKTASTSEQSPPRNDDQSKNCLKEGPEASKSPAHDRKAVDIDQKTAPVSCLGLGAYESDDD